MGELVAAPFRFFQDTNFNGNFEVFNERAVPIRLAESGLSARTSNSLRDFLADANSGFRNTALSEQSVAATRWRLEINPGQISIQDINDIEIVFVHRSVERPMISCPTDPMN